MRRRTARAAAGLGAVTSLVLLTGCGGAGGMAPAGSASAACTPADELILVVGVHQNVPAPNVPAELACDIESTIRAQHKVSVVTLEGQPRPVLSETFELRTANDAAMEDDIKRAASAVVTAVREAAATSDGADLTEALAVASDLDASDGTRNARIAVIDSGLSDRGPLNMTAPGMLGANPAEVAAYVSASGLLPDLAGQEIKLVGTGYSALPQQPLNAAQRANVDEILTASLSAAGASVTVVPVPRTGEGPDTSYVTATVTLPEDQTYELGGTQALVFDDTSPVGFQPDSTELRDPEAARATLTALADWLAADPTRTALITGTSASVGPPEGQVAISKERAEAVKTLLVELGVNADQITTVGAGYTASPPDRLPDGTLDPAAAALNRSVRVTTSQAAAQPPPPEDPGPSGQPDRRESRR